MTQEREQQTSQTSTIEHGPVRLTRRGRRALAGVALGLVAGAAAAVGALLPTNGEAQAAHDRIVADQAADAERVAAVEQFEASIQNAIEQMESTGANIIDIQAVGQGGNAESTIISMIPQSEVLSEQQDAATVISAKIVDGYFEELHGGALRPTDEIALAEVEINGEDLYIGIPRTN